MGSMVIDPGFFLCLPKILPELDDLPRLLKEHRISRQILSGSRVDTPAENLCALLDHIADWYGEPCVGFKLGRLSGPDHFGPAGRLLVHCPDIRTAIMEGSRNVSAFSNGVDLWLEEAGEVAWLKWDNRFASRDRFQFTCQSLIHGYNILEAISPTRLNVRAVQLQCDAALGAQVLEHYFAAPVTFGAEFNGIAFDRSLLDRPSARAHSTVRDFLRPHIAASASPGIVGRVARQIPDLLEGGQGSLDQLAERLAISRRKLQRELNSAGTSYRQLLVDARKGLSPYLLHDPQLSCLEVAIRLGFGSSEEFSRAFRDWYGEPPNRWRKRLYRRL